MNLNKPIKLKLPPQKGKGYQVGEKRTFTVPPLNAKIATSYGPPPPVATGYKAIVTVPANQLPVYFSWGSLGTGGVDDPNKYRTVKLQKYKPLKAPNQLCCGSCWVFSTSSAFADRYGIANDELPVEPNYFGVLSCCTADNYKKTFGIIATPNCNVNGTYGDLAFEGTNASGMCNGGIPYSAAKSIQQNGLAKTSNQPYTASLFQCESGVNPNQQIISKYPCSKDIFKEGTVKMSGDPWYISNAAQARGSPDYYVRLMKNYLRDGPLVAGFVVTGDFITLGAQVGWKPGAVDWDSTGKVFVNGAYNQRWPQVSLSEVGGQATIKKQFVPEKNTIMTTGSDTVAPLGDILCGFHAIVIVGYGEMDIDYVPDKTVKFVTGRDGRKKLPFWVCRNSWGTEWPPADYYGGKVQVSKTEYVTVPPGYWLHAMYPNESLALDIPVIFDSADYGCTMVMSATGSVPTTGPTKPVKFLSRTCNNTWKDSDGFGCSDYGQQLWCTKSGMVGPGWKKEWGALPSEALGCCECQPDTVAVARKEGFAADSTCYPEGTIIGLSVGLGIPTLILLVWVVYMMIRRRR